MYGTQGEFITLYYRKMVFGKDVLIFFGLELNCLFIFRVN
jgi:hypothetical protein